MFWTFIIGFVFGVAVVLAIIFILVCDPYGQKVDEHPFVDQFRPIEIPEELQHFLETGEDGSPGSKWESTFSLTMLLHLLYQEHKDTRALRRWLHKRLQLELNDITTRSTAGRLIQDIRIRDLSLGSKVPTINKMRVEKVEMSEDQSIFESVSFLIDLEYDGGFETSIDVQAMVVGSGTLSLKITRLAGKLRLMISRKPFTHWAFSFENTPDFEFEIGYQIQGHRLRHIVPLIREQIRRALQRKHVWPNYKIRYRPIFPNPLLQPSPPSSSYSHVKLQGGLEVTVLECSRLNVRLIDNFSSYVVYCTVTLDHKPFLQGNDASLSHSISVLLTFIRFDTLGVSGLSFVRSGRTQSNIIQVANVEPGSLADKAHFKKGDIIVAINSLPVRSERQVESLLRMKGELSVLVERNLEDIVDQELLDGEKLVGDIQGLAVTPARLSQDKLNEENLDDLLDADTPVVSMRNRSNSASGESTRRHSLSILPESTPVTHGTPSFSQSVSSSINDLKIDHESHKKPVDVSVNRTESARIPQVFVSTSSIDLRRTRSESQIGQRRTSNTFQCLQQPVDPEEMFDLSAQSLCEPEQVSSEIENGKLEVLKTDNSRAPLVNSQTSLASSISLHSSNLDESIGNCSKLDQDKPQSTRRARIHTALAAGKKKVFDLIPQKRRPSSTVIDNGESVELGLDAGELPLSESEKHSRANSPMPSSSKLPAEFVVKDQENDGKAITDNETKEKTKHGLLGRKKRGSPLTPHKPIATLHQAGTENLSTSPSPIHSRSTKATHLKTNVIWGQSLHFELNNEALPIKRYLNLTVHARENLGLTSTSQSSDDSPREPARPVLLGYTSLYLPQIIDDCRLTLSNCHREIFHLKAPHGMTTSTISSTELSRHPGFDPRLLFGDVTLNFRYFPSGLPEEAKMNMNDSSDEEVRAKIISNVDSAPKGTVTVQAILQSNHDWKPWSAKQSAYCAICKGKIWLKTGLCCSRCFAVCHLKCQARESAGIVCIPNAFSKHDENFEDISSAISPNTTNTLEVQPNEETCDPFNALVGSIPTESKIPPLELEKRPYQSESETVSRRTKFKARMTEKLGQLTWRKKKDPHEDANKKVNPNTDKDNSNVSSPMASIASCLSDLLPQLEGSPFLTAIYFQPGNAYNEETIDNAKRLGKEIFRELTAAERRRRINEQIDRIQVAIHETKTGRLEAMNQTTDDNKSETSSNPQQNFEGLDERLQALAVLMLHYCAALQDCCEQEDGEHELVPTTETET